MIYLTEQDALELLTIHDALTAVAQTLMCAAKGTAAVAPRSRASHKPSAGLMSGRLATRGSAPALVRTDQHQVTAFVSHSLRTWDTALAQTLYTKAQGDGRGVTLPVEGAPTQGRR
jgi:ornithine cyclodeaminase/alanine dehydrogenase-like protein (mu-crystallin family)